MKTAELGKTGLNVSRIGLGTVEIGISDYAVGQTGLVSEKDAIRLLQEVADMGVTYIDTARAYGVAEERIGKSGILKSRDVVVGTKCAQFLEKGEDPRGEELEKLIRADVEESLRQLQTDSLQLVQLHGGNKEQIERGEIIEVMKTLQGEGKVQHVGIAVRSEDAALAAIDSGFFATIQLAYSILDQRMGNPPLPPYQGGQNGVLATAHKHNIGVINRSVLLKGVLTRNYPNLPDALAPLKTAAEKADAIAQELGTILPVLALRFVLNNPSITTALVGTVKSEHIAGALKAAESESLPPEVLEQLEQLAISDPNMVDPAKWPKETQTV
jgi:aryl-alcohol dehydrogenase-like predicted oxidoreductase